MPTSGHYKSSFEKALDEKRFQVPFYAGLLSLAFLDGEITDGASEDTPIFGSQANAASWSDALLAGMIPLMIYSSSLAKRNQPGQKPTNITTTQLIGMQSLFVLADFLVIGATKMAVRRERPDSSNALSFPSGHSSVSSGLSAGIYNNVVNSGLQDTTQGRTLRGAGFVMSSLTAWARVEGKKHHISDVFFGNAFGFLISDFLYNSFLLDRSNFGVSFNLHGERKSALLTYRF